jgi:hypothetical protein
VITARSGGILFEISALENSHDLLWEMTGASCVWINQCLKTGIQQDEVQKKISISLNRKDSFTMDAHYCFAKLGN